MSNYVFSSQEVDSTGPAGASGSVDDAGLVLTYKKILDQVEIHIGSLC